MGPIAITDVPNFKKSIFKSLVKEVGMRIAIGKYKRHFTHNVFNVLSHCVYSLTCFTVPKSEIVILY